MHKFLRAAAVGGLALLLCLPASAQNLSLRAPQWAQALLSADVTPTTGGRAFISAEGVSLAVRVTLAPTRGGVARVIRYEEDIMLEVGECQFDLEKNPSGLIADGDELIVYYLERTEEILSVEAL